MRTFAFVLVLAAAVAAPVLAQAQGDASELQDRMAAQQIEQARANARAHPGAPYEAQVFSQQVVSAHLGGTVKRKKADGKALVAEADGYLEAAIKAHPEEAPRLYTARGSMYQEAGRKADAAAAFKKAADAAQAQAKAAARPGAPAPSASIRPGVEAPSAPVHVSVTVASACGKPVSLGSGPDVAFATPSPWAAGFSMPLTFRVGDGVFLFDDAGKPVAQVRVTAQTKAVDVGKDCRSLVSRP